MLADTNGKFCKAAGLDWPECAPVFGSVRCHRFLMLVDDGEVKLVEVEESAGTEPTCTLANQAPLMKALGQ